VRIVQENGELLFVGKDVCKLLGYKNESDAISRHCKGGVKRYPLLTEGGIQELRVLSEPDVMRLICGSKLPAAVRFEKWVFEEVLPSIRKTGAYVSPNVSNEEIKSLVATIEEEVRHRIQAEDKIGFLERQIEKLTEITMPKRKFGEISETTGLPMDKVISTYLRSDKRKHEPENGKYIQLLLPLYATRELLDNLVGTTVQRIEQTIAN